MKAEKNKNIEIELLNMFDNIQLYLLGDNYTNNFTKMNLCDNIGYKYYTNYASLKKYSKRGNSPSITNNNPHASDNIKLFVKLNIPELEVISDIDDNSKVIIRCEHGHESPINIYHLIDRRRCPKCNKAREININIARESFKNKGYTLIETEYKNNNTKMAYICDKHFEYGVQYSNFGAIDGNFGGCDLCKLEKLSKANTKSNEDFVKEFNDIYGSDFEVISVYKSTNDEVSIKHVECGKVFNRTPKVLLRNKNYCPYCQTTGEFANSWKGGLTPIRQRLREYCKEIFDIPTFILFNGKCAITNSNKSTQTHHLYSFSSILYDNYNENIINCDIEILYDIIKDSIKLTHINYGLGIVLNKDVHNLFHSQYGIKNNTHLQFKQFIQRLQSGEFDEYLNEHNLILNLNYEALNKLALL